MNRRGALVWAAVLAGAMPALAAASTAAGGGGSSGATGVTGTTGTTGAPRTTITVDVSGDGVVTATQQTPCSSHHCPMTVQPGHALVLRAVPVQGHTFDAWTRGCYGSGTICIVTPAAAAAVRAKFITRGQVEVTVSGPGGVISSPPGITCGAGSMICNAPFEGGHDITLTPSPSPGGTFLGWGGACAQYATEPCHLRSGGESGITAEFGAPFLASGYVPVTVDHGGLALSSAPNVLGACPATGICGANLPPNVSLTLTAGGPFELSPFQPLAQVEWSGGCIGNWPVCALAVDGPTNVTVAPPGPTVPYSIHHVASRLAGSIPLTLSGRGSLHIPSGICRSGSRGCKLTGLYAGAKITLQAQPAPGTKVKWFGVDCTPRGLTCKGPFDPSLLSQPGETVQL